MWVFKIIIHHTRWSVRQSLGMSLCVARILNWLYLHSSVSFNPYHKTTLASADYEGCVSVWDVNTSCRKSSHHEHSKRVWSVVYNPTEPVLYASGSDDSTGMCFGAGLVPSAIVIFLLSMQLNCGQPTANKVFLLLTLRPTCVQFSFIPITDSTLLLAQQVNQNRSPKLWNCYLSCDADHSIHYMDMRKPQVPLHQLKGHRKAVSYVHFISDTQVVSA